jgi:hypothetical protein
VGTGTRIGYSDHELHFTKYSCRLAHIPTTIE